MRGGNLIINCISSNVLPIGPTWKDSSSHDLLDMYNQDCSAG